MKSEIICVGTELLLGDQVDLNSPFIAKSLANMGIDVFYQTNVGDNGGRLKEIIKIAMERSDLIIITGGLGPTEDDLTKENLADLLKIPLYQDEKEVNRLKEFFAKREQQMPCNNYKQALIIKGAKILPNRIGTASGIALVNNEKIFILLPGPPVEMEHVFSEEGIPWLDGLIGEKKEGIYSQVLKFIGISESRLEEELIDLFQEQTNPTLALLAKNGEIQIRITAKVADKENFHHLIQPVKEKILLKVGQYCYGYDQDNLEKIIITTLREKGKTLATIESCTAGLIAKRLTDIPGSSAAFKGGIIPYTNEIKNQLLNISTEILNNEGAVSREAAVLMAKEALKLFNVDFAIAITGNAGPESSENKPVGLTYIALVGNNMENSEKWILTGDRMKIRWLASNHALNLLRKNICEK